MRLFILGLENGPEQLESEGVEAFYPRCRWRVGASVRRACIQGRFVRGNSQFGSDCLYYYDEQSSLARKGRQIGTAALDCRGWIEGYARDSLRGDSGTREHGSPSGFEISQGSRRGDRAGSIQRRAAKRAPPQARTGKRRIAYVPSKRRRKDRA